MAKVKTHVEESDVLIIGGGMAGTGATFEARHWGRDLKIGCVENQRQSRFWVRLYSKPSKTKNC